MNDNVSFRFRLKHVFFHSRSDRSADSAPPAVYSIQYVRSNWIRVHGPGHPGGQFWSKSFCLYYLYCKKIGQLTIRKILEIVATRCQILRIQCIKFDFGSAPDPAGGAYSAPPDPLAGFKWAYF